MASKEYHQQKSREYRAARRQYVADQKMARGCEQCGYNKHPAALHLDHIKPQQKSVTVSKMISEGYPYTAIDAEMDKCRVLCANCHAIHSHEQKHHLIPRMGTART